MSAQMLVAHLPLPPGAFGNFSSLSDSAESPSTLARINGKISGFNDLVKDDLVDQGAQADRDGNRAGFVWNGIKYAVYNTVMPNSVQEAAINTVGGPVIGKSLGWLGKVATHVWPGLGKGIGNLAAGIVGIGRRAFSGATDVVPSTAATSIGKSGYASMQEFSNAAYPKYQTLVDEGYANAQKALQEGTLQVPSGISQQTILGSYTDRYARQGMRLWLETEGIEEGADKLIQVNRYLYDPARSGVYRIPDFSIPGANRIYDATLGFKSWSTPQIRGFYKYSEGRNITIVRPTQLGGSYSVIVPR